MKLDSAQSQLGIAAEDYGDVSQTRLELGPLVVVHVRREGLRRAAITLSRSEKSSFLWISLGSPAAVKMWLASGPARVNQSAPDSSWVTRAGESSLVEVEGLFEAIALAFNADRFDPFAVAAATSTGIIQSASPMVDSVTHDLCSCLAAALGRPGSQSYTFLGMVMRALAVHLGSLCSKRFSEAPSDARGRLATWQENRVKELIAAKIDSKINLKAFADECSLSVSHFSYLFKRTTGLSPYRYLINCRLARAKDLMQKTPLTLLEIALSAGFGSQIQFNRIFSQTYGITPGTWRRQNRISSGPLSSESARRTCELRPA
ncbi:AraC-like DNA-binding protein [Paraburkholderia sp. GAS199]|uniref:helix-turn-helix domain-containing protein n=1 Tax=Paraburkholderia sp. GAS199 TaxID=3035126 RepID=UPI003D1BF0E4